VLVRASCHQRPARLAVFGLAAIALLVTATWARADDPAGVAGLRSANASLSSRSQQALLELYSLQRRREAGARLGAETARAGAD
jgi:hypothetical protein